MEGKLGWVALPSIPSYVEYQVNSLSPLNIDQASDKRNRNPNWTDAEITRFLMILMEEPVLNDLNAQRNKQVCPTFIISLQTTFHPPGLLLCLP